jgi:HlyD family secretion protein
MNKQILLLLAIAGYGLSSCGKKMAETKPIRKDVTETVFASGILEAKNTYNLTAQADGYLTLLNIREGDIVQAGAVLAVVDNKEAGLNEQSAGALYDIARSNVQSNAPALQQAQVNINISKQKMEQESVNYQRYQKLWADNSIARQELENAALQYQTAKANYETALESYKQLQQQAKQQEITSRATKSINTIITGKNQIRAVVAGRVYKKYKQVGDYVKRGETIAVLGSATDIYAKVNIDEGNIARVKIGQEATVQLNTNKDKLYKAVVREIYPSFDEATQSFICVLYFTDSLGFDIVNTQLQSNIIVGTHKQALLIPRNYLDFGGHIKIKGVKDPIKVVTNFVGKDWVQVLSGINEQTILVTDNIPSNKSEISEAGREIMGQ